MPDSFLHRNRFPRPSGIHQPPDSDYPRICRKGLAAGLRCASSVLLNPRFWRVAYSWRPDCRPAVLSPRRTRVLAFASLRRKRGATVGGRQRVDALLASPDHGPSVDLHPAELRRAVPLSREFRQLSDHPKNTMAWRSIRAHLLSGNSHPGLLDI